MSFFVYSPAEERGLSAAAFSSSHFHSLHVSNEVHWDSNLVTLVPAESFLGLHTLLAPPCRLNPHLKMTHE